MEDTILFDIGFNEDSLNKSIRQIEDKISRLKLDICPKFCDDAFSYKIDDRPLMEFDRKLANITKKIEAQTLALNLKINAPRIDPDIQKILSGTENRTVTVRYKDISNERTGYQNQTKEIVLGLQKVERAVSRNKNNLGILDGIKLGIGQTIARGIDQQIKRDFGISGTGVGRKVVEQASRPVKFLVDDNPEFKEFLKNKADDVNKSVREFLYKIGDSAVEAIDSDPTENRVQVFKKSVLNKLLEVDKGIKTANDEFSIDNTSTKNLIAQKVKKEFKTLGVEAKKAVNEGVAAIFNERVKLTIGDKVGDKFVKNYRLPALQERAIPEVLKRVEEIEKGKRKPGQQTGYIKEIKPDDQTLLLTIGGYAGQAKSEASLGMSSKRIAKDFRDQQIPGLVAQAVQGTDTDFTEQKKESVGVAKAMMESLAKPNLRGYSKDSVEMVAQAIAALKQNPNLDVKFLGESGGGFAAAEAKQLMDLLGYQSKYLAVGTPDFIGGFDKNTKNRLLSPDEHLGKDVATSYKQKGLARMKTRQQNIPGIFGHQYEYYQDALQPELVNFVAGKPEKITDTQLRTLRSFSSDIEKYRSSSFGSDFELQAFTKNLKQDLQILRRNALAEDNSDISDELEDIAQKIEDSLIRLGELPNLSSRGDEELFTSSIAGMQELDREINDLFKEFSTLSDEKLKGNAGNVFNKKIETLQKKLKNFKVSPGISQARKSILEKDLNTLSASIKDPKKFKYDAGDQYGFDDDGFDITSISANNKPELSPKQLERLKAVQGGNINSISKKGQGILVGLNNLNKLVGENIDDIQQEIQEVTKKAKPDDLDIEVKDFESAYQDIKEKVQNFNASFQTIKEALKQGDPSNLKLATGTSQLVLGNIPRAIGDIESIRSRTGTDKISSTEASKLNQLLSQLTQVENKIKREFAKRKLELPPLELPDLKVNNVIQLGENITEGVAVGLENALPELKDAAKELVDVAEQEVKNQAQIQSPSKLFEKLGEFMGEGLQKGIESFPIDFDKILSFGKLATAIGIGINLFNTFGRALIDVGREFEAIEVKLSFGSGSISSAGEAMRFVTEESDRLGTNLRQTADSYADFLATTKSTPLKGFATEQIFTGVQEASVVRNLNRQDQEGVNRAITQILNKGTVQREELVGQLGERLTGTLELAASSRGQTQAEFNRDTKRGLVSSEEFLPKFAQALSADAALSLPNALDSSQAIINRYDNSILKLQNTLSKPLVAVENTGLKVLTTVFEGINATLPVTINLLGVILLRSLASLAPEIKLLGKELIGLVSSVGGLKTIGATLGKLAIQTVGLMALVEVIQALGKSFSNASGELKNFAKASSEGLSRFQQIKKESLGEKVAPKYIVDESTKLVGNTVLKDANTGDLALRESAIGQGIVGFLPDCLKKSDDFLTRIGFSIRSTIQDYESVITNYSEKAKNDRINEVKTLIKASDDTNQEIKNLLNDGDVSKTNQIDKQLRDLANKRRGIALTDPGNQDALTEIREKEQELLKQREKVSKPSLVLQAQTSKTIESLKKSIEELERVAAIPSQYQGEYAAKAEELKSQLKEAEKAQTELNKAIKAGLDNFTLFGQRIERISDQFRDFQTRQRTLSLNTSSAVNQSYSPNEASSEQVQSIKTQLDLQIKVTELDKLKQTLTEMRALINEQLPTLQPYGVDANTGVSELQRLLEQVGSDPSAAGAKTVLEKLIEYKQLEQEFPQLVNDVTQAQADLARSVRDSAKAVNDFYRELSNTADNLALETKQVANSNALSGAKVKLKSALVNSRDGFVTNYVNGLVSILEQLNKPLESTLEAQKQILATQQNRLNQQLSLEDLRKQQPVDISGNIQNNGNPFLGNAIASPSTTQSLDQVLRGSVSQGQGFNGQRTGRLHSSIDFDNTEGLGGHQEFNAMFPGRVANLRQWGANAARDRMGGEESNAIRIITKLANGLEFFTDYGHYEVPSAKVNEGQTVNAGQRLGRLSGDDTLSRGGHLDLKIRVPQQLAANFKTTRPDPKSGMVFVEVKEFMKWYRDTQVSQNPQPPQQNRLPVNNVTQNPLNNSALNNGVNNVTQKPITKFGHFAYNEAPKNELTRLPKNLSQGNQLLHRDAANAFKLMADAAKQDGIDLKVVSGFRSVKDQANIFESIRRQRNQTPEQRAKVSAPPGFSQHHTGLAVDINSTDPSFANTKAYQWLAKNGNRFGFQQPFTKNNSQGIDFEPWHWKYQGSERARQLGMPKMSNVTQNLPTNRVNNVTQNLPIQSNNQGIQRGGNQLSPQELARLTPKGRKLYELRNDPRILALGDTIARAEGTDFRANSKNFGYGMLIGGKHTNDLSTHPFVDKNGNKSRAVTVANSTASGRYQMMDFNYSGKAARRMNSGWRSDLSEIFQGDNPQSFSPGVQDLYFIASLEKRGVLDEVLKGDFTGALSSKNLANHYASLQSGNNRSAYKGQGTPEGRLSNTVPFAQQRLRERLKGNQNQTIPQFNQASNQQLSFNAGNNEAIARSNQQIISNSDQQIANIRSRLQADNQLATLEAEIQKTKTRNDFSDGLIAAETQANQASRTLQDQRSSLGYDTPEKQRLTQVRQINREFVDTTRDLTKQLTELTDQRRVLAATKNLIESGQFPQLSSELPMITDGLTRLDRSIEIVDEALKQSSKVRTDRLNDIDQKFAVEEDKRKRQAEIVNLRNDSNNKKAQANLAEVAQRGNVGDLSKGDPLKLRNDATNNEILASYLEQVLALEDMERQGERTTEQIAALKKQYEEYAKIQTDTNNLKLQQDLYKRILAIESRDLQIQQKSASFETSKTEELAKRNELITRRTGNIEVKSPAALRLENQINNSELNLKQSINEIKTFANEQGLSEQATNNMIAALTELNNLSLGNLREELKLTNEEQQRNVETAKFELKKRLSDSDNSVTQAQGEYYSSFGLSDRDQQRQIAISNQNINFEDGLRQIDEYARTANLSAESVAKLRNNLVQLNEIKLTNIKNQFDPFQEVAKSAIGGLQTGIEGLLNGTMSFQDAFQSFGQTISNTLAKLAAEYLVNDLFKGLLGMKTPSVATSDSGFGGITGILGSILGFKDGGDIKPLNHQGYRALPVIGDAMRKEGNNSVLATLTPGEYVLTTDEAKLYKTMFPKGIQGFKQGGSVGNIPVQSMVAANKSTNNVNVNIAQNSGNNNDVDVNALRVVILSELDRQQQQGGRLYRP